jgi:capsule biosynthesis phosphatase
MNIIIPIGGVGKRFSDDNYTLPKPLIKSLGKPVIFWVIENLKLNIDDTLYIIYRDEFKKFNFESLLVNKFRKINFKFISIKNDTRGASETVLYGLNNINKEELEKPTIIVDSDNFYYENIIEIVKNTKNKNIIFYKKDYDKNPIYSYIKIGKDNSVLNIKEKDKISDNACVGAYSFESGILLKEVIEKVIKQNIKQKNEYYISSLYDEMIKDKLKINSVEIEKFNCLGTPNQLKSFSSNFNTDNQKYRFCFDLDNTLVTYPEVEGDYSTVKPIERTINYLNYLHSMGHTIIIHTARRMRTHGGNMGRVQADIAKVTFETIDKFKINYDEIYFGKPYANFYIDDLSVKPFDDIEKEIGFYNIHPETRSHNKIEIYENYIIKYSNDISGEKYYYNNIPNEIINLFPELLEEDENSIRLSKITGIPLSFINSNETISENILSLVFDTISKIHDVSDNNIEDINIYLNYYEKVKNRISNYDFTRYDRFEGVKENILDFLKKYENDKSGKIGVIHGDSVFTNILIDNNDNIKFIDMRGKLGDNLTIYGDIFYDWAKVYQSIIGYDHILMGKNINDSFINKNIEIFEKYIINKYGRDTLNNIKNITKSLIISLIPIHDNDKCFDYYNLIKKC